MNAKQQYHVAYSAIRAIRRYNRARVAYYQYVGAYPYPQEKDNALENLVYAVEKHISQAAVAAIIDAKFTDNRFMSNRLLGGGE